MQIWDTAGQERFKTITQSYYKGAMGIILVYSIDDRNSFNSLDNWSKQIKLHASEHVIKVLIANKCDCENRKVSYEEGKAMAESIGLNFFEVSAKENVNIQDTFIYMAKEIKDKILVKEKTMYPDSKGGKLKEQQKAKKKSFVC